MRRRPLPRAFTLVEILIVVVILGMLAAIVVPQMSSAVQDSAATTTYSELQKIRRHILIYKARHANQLPSVNEGDGTWGPLIGVDHLLAPPVNAWVGGANSRVIIFGDTPDDLYQSDYGWIFDNATGEVYAGGFDANDQPLPRN
ncbi:MAG: type II secretion system protein [Phycisphaerales bacterium]